MTAHILLKARKNQDEFLASPILNREIAQTLKALQYIDKESALSYYQQLSAPIQENFVIAEATLKLNHQVVEYLPENLQHNLDLGKIAALERLKEGYLFDENTFKHFPRNMMENIEMAFFLIRQEPVTLNMLPAKFNQNRDIVEFSVRKFNAKLKDAAKPFQDDYKIVQMAVENDIMALKHASIRLQDNKDIVMKSVTKWGCALQYASKRLQSDLAIGMAALQQNVLAIQYMSPSLLDNEEIITYAVNEWGCALKYASKRLQSKKEIVAMAVAKTVDAFEFASAVLKNEFDFVKNVVSRKGLMLEFASLRLRRNHDIAMTAVTQNGAALQWVLVKTRKIKSIYTTALKSPTSIFFTEPPVCFNGVLLMKGVQAHYIVEVNLERNKEVNSALINFLNGLSPHASNRVGADNLALVEGIKKLIFQQETLKIHKMLRAGAKKNFNIFSQSRRI